MITSLNRSQGNTIELTITIEWPQIKDTYEKIFNDFASRIELPGFRKGKAPPDIVKKQINKNKIYEEVLKELVPKVYADAVKEQNLHPIISPKVDVLEAEENKAWKLKITTAEIPDIDLGNYKKAIAELKSAKQTKIWVPGEKKEEDKPKGPTVGEVLDAIYKIVKADLSPLIIEDEVNRMLSNLVNELQKLGLTVEQYLKSQGKTSDQLRSEYQEQAKKTLVLEFALEKLADTEKITVEPSEVDTVIKNAKTDEEKKTLENQKYYITGLLRRQKTLAKLLESPVISQT